MIGLSISGFIPLAAEALGESLVATKDLHVLAQRNGFLKLGYPSSPKSKAVDEDHVLAFLEFYVLKKLLGRTFPKKIPARASFGVSRRADWPVHGVQAKAQNGVGLTALVSLRPDAIRALLDSCRAASEPIANSKELK